MKSFVSRAISVVVVGVVGLSVAVLAADAGVDDAVSDAASSGDAASDDEKPAATAVEKPNRWRSRIVPVVDEKAPAPLERPEDLLARLPAFTVQPRTPVLKENGMFPCSDCHDGMEPDLSVRELVEEHDTLKLVHGGGRFWCHTCHDAVNRDVLKSLDDKPISYDQSFLLCGQCHFAAQRDFVNGAHGKRVGNWQGDRVIQACTSCHDAHSPSIKARAPADIPKTRREIHRRPANGVMQHITSTTPSESHE